MILEYKNYVDSDFVDEIRQSVIPFLNASKKTMHNRDGVTVNISETPELFNLDQKICKLFSELQNKIVKLRYNPMKESGDSGYEYHLYSPGDMCHYHADGEIMDGFVRYATVILFLSDNEDGDLIFPTQNVEIKPEKGKIVVFPPYGFFGHYAKPSVKNREILMTWFVYNGVRVIEDAT